ATPAWVASSVPPRRRPGRAHEPRRAVAARRPRGSRARIDRCGDDARRADRSDAFPARAWRRPRALGTRVAGRVGARSRRTAGPWGAAVAGGDGPSRPRLRRARRCLLDATTLWRTGHGRPGFARWRPRAQAAL